MISYYISFVHQGDLGPEFGTGDIHRDQPICMVDDVQSVTAWLVQQGYRNPTVLSFSRYGEQGNPIEDRNQPGPVDNLSFEYIRQLLQEQARPLTADQIAVHLGFPVDAVRRVTQRAAQNRRLVVTDGRYSLPRKAGRR